MSPEMTTALGTWGPIALMIAVFYFLLYRPQKTERKRRLAMLDSLKRGDEVVTIGGIYGKIASLDEQSVRLQVAEHTEIKVSRAAVNAKVTDDKD